MKVSTLLTRLQKINSKLNDLRIALDNVNFDQANGAYFDMLNEEFDAINATTAHIATWVSAHQRRIEVSNV